MNDACQYPAVTPSRENPSGDCLCRPVTHAVPLGRSGRWLALCSPHAEHRVDAIPIEQVPEEP